MNGQSSQAQYVVTITHKTSTGKTKRKDIRTPCDRVQITDMRDESDGDDNDGKIVIELIRNKTATDQVAGGIDVEHVYLDQPGDVAYISNSLTGKTVETVDFDKYYKQKETQVQRLRI